MRYLSDYGGDAINFWHRRTDQSSLPSFIIIRAVTVITWPVEHLWCYLITSE